MNRQDLTNKLVELLPDNKKITVNEAMFSWWMNPRSTGGYRLTDEGYNTMAKILEFEHWTISAPANLKLILELDKKLQSPYYVKTKKKEIVLFGSRDAMMASLHGDLKRYIELLDRRSK
jgi:hypothetical protein